MKVEEFLKEHKEKYNTKDAVYSSYHYDAMEQFANQRVIEELEALPKQVVPLGATITISYFDVLTRIKEIKQERWKY